MQQIDTYKLSTIKLCMQSWQTFKYHFYITYQIVGTLRVNTTSVYILIKHLRIKMALPFLRMSIFPMSHERWKLNYTTQYWTCMYILTESYMFLGKRGSLWDEHSEVIKLNNYRIVVSCKVLCEISGISIVQKSHGRSILN